MVLKEFVERPLIMSAVRRADLPVSLHIPPGQPVGLLYACLPSRPALDVRRLLRSVGGRPNGADR